MRITYPKLPNMTHALSLSVFIVFKGIILQTDIKCQWNSVFTLSKHKGCSKAYTMHLKEMLLITTGFCKIIIPFAQYNLGGFFSPARSHPYIYTKKNKHTIYYVYIKT